MVVGGAPLQVNTFVGHNWIVHVDGAPVRTWTIADEPKSSQPFELRASDLAS
jgi:hypothetical protein